MKTAALIAALAMVIPSCSESDSLDPGETVEFFGKQMARDWAEMLEASQRETHYIDEDGQHGRIPYGSETFITIENTRAIPCRHCDTIHGKLHEPGCDYEECPKCNGGIMNCECDFRGHEWRENEEG